MTIGYNIRRYRKEKKLSQEKLSELIGKSKSILVKYEADKVTPPLKTVEDIAKALDVSPIDIYNTTGEEIIKFGFNNMIEKYNRNTDYDALMKYKDNSDITYEELIVLKNKIDYKEELNNQVPLYDKLKPKQLELLYLSKINDLNSIIEENKKTIDRLEKMNDKLFSLLDGGNNGK